MTARLSVLTRGARRLPKRVKRLVRRLLSNSSLARVGLDEVQERNALELRAVRSEANALWKKHKNRDSLDLLRQGLLRYPHDSEAWQTYGSRLLESGRPDSAFEALKNSVELDPFALDALEILNEMQRLRDPSARYVQRALDRMLESLPGKSGKHRDILDFAIPGRRNDICTLLRESSDPVTRGVVALAESGVSAGSQRVPFDQLELSSEDRVLAEVHFALAKGRVVAAVNQLDGLEPKLIPLRSVRRAARRSLNKGDSKGAHLLLEQYLRCAPKDGWAKAKYAETRSPVLTQRELTLHGYPAPVARLSPVYKPDLSRAFYLLHNSLPFHSAGYATRTHGMLTSLSGRGWDMRAITRLGYPFDMPGYKELQQVPRVSRIDDVHYQRLHGDRAVFRRNPLQGYVERYAFEVERLARRDRPFLIHAASNYVNGLAAAIAARRLGLPSVYEVRGLWEITRGSRDPEWRLTEEYEFHARMEAEAARHCTEVIAITEALAEELVKRGVDEQRISVVPNGVDTTRFIPTERDEVLALELGLKDRTVIGYVGSLLDYEGLDDLVRAFAEIPFLRQKSHLLIVGDGPTKAYLERLARELDVDDAVTFTGRVPHAEVARYYSVIDIAPFPRRPLPVCEMVSPLKPLEALAMGKVVVASDVAALAEMIQDGETGQLHQKGNASSLASVLAGLINDPDQRRALSNQGRQWVESERTWPALMDKVSKIYMQHGAVLPD